MKPKFDDIAEDVGRQAEATTRAVSPTQFNKPTLAKDTKRRRGRTRIDTDKPSDLTSGRAGHKIVTLRDRSQGHRFQHGPRRRP